MQRKFRLASDNDYFTEPHSVQEQSIATRSVSNDRRRVSELR